MPLSGDDLICPKFQPNIFDSSRCHDCLRQKHLHAGTDAPPQVSPGTDSNQGQQPVAEEKDSSAKEDSDAQSVVSSYCDVSGGQRGYEENSLHILSSDCQRYLCDGDDDEDSTDSQDYCDYPDFGHSASADDDYHPVHRISTYSSMTRLDPPPHRPNPRAWMEESRSRDSFGRHSVGSRGDRERESGYFSLGKAGGIRSFRDQSPPAPYRHSERGHPIPSTRSPEPKDTIPFRNRDLGVPSLRRGTELQNADYLEEGPPPEPTPLERSIEVEAQVGPRSPSPTPFKQAEAFASNRRGLSGSCSRAKSPSPYSSSQQQSRRGASLSRSSSPARSTSSFKRSESVASLNSRNFGSNVTQGLDHRSRSPPSQNSYGRGLDSGGGQRNFRSIATTVGSKSLSSSYADLRGSLRKAESTTSLASRGLTSRSSSPSRRGYETPGQSMLHKSETAGSLSGHNRDTRNSSPTRRGYDTPGQSMLRRSETAGSLSGHNRDTRNSSPTRRGYETPGQSMLRKSETNGTLSGHNRDIRSSSPSRRGYDTPSQSMLRKSETRSSTNAYGLDRRNTSPSRTSYDHQSQSFSQRTEKKTSYGRDSPSPSRKGLDSSRPSIKLKNETKSSLSRSSSPSRNGYDTSSQSVLRFTETSRPKHCQGPDSRSPSPSRRGYDIPRQSLQRKSETDSFIGPSGRNSRSSSPSKRGTDLSSQSALRKTVSYDSRTNATSSYTKKTVNSHGRMDSNHSPGSWRGSSHSLCSPPTSRSPSPLRKTSENRPLERSQRSSSAVLGNGRNGSRSSSSSRLVTEQRSLAPEVRKSSGQNRSQSPHMRRLTSSQSSMDSTESSHFSGGSTGFNKEEYAMMADLPKVKTVFQREGPNHLGRLETHHSGEERLYKPASHSHTKNSNNSWDSGGDHQDGRLTRTHSSTSLNFQRACSPTMEEVQPWKGQQRSPRQSQRMSQGRPSVYFSPSVESAEESPIEQPDLLNFKKGWMSKLDDNGEWKKHWFVLTDAGLRYYRDSGAEEKDDLDGEIDLKSCVKVSEYDVEKNYGFQIQTREAVFTLSAMTAGIRRNWIEVLRKSVRPSSSPDLTQLPDGNSDKENSHGRSLSSTARRHHSQSHSHVDSSTSGSAQRRFDYVELSPVATPGGLGSSTQREAGEGQVREGGSWREEEQRSRESTASQWEAVLSRKGPGQGGDGKQRIEDEIERKWAEFERLPLKEMRSLSATPGSRASSGPLASEALQREVASLRQQLEHLKKGGEGGGVGEKGRKEEGGGGGGGGGGTRGECGPLAPCGRSLRAMELAHRHALEELQKQHGREVQELQQERDRLLKEETQATEKAMEVLKKAHREELERELEKARRLGTSGTDAMTLSAQQRAETATLQRELQGLSERYSQKCLELNRVEQSAEERERDASRKEREMQLLKQENQDLQARLTEEVNRMRSLVTGQGSEGIADANRDRKSCELEVLLRVKENEVLYLQKEISCLRNELQCLNSEKRSACARYKEVHEELSSMKSRSEREIQSLREHLKLAMAALQEGQRLGNSLEH